MKLRKGSNQGSVLVITIVICALVGLMLSAYLSMVANQHNFTQRSQVWNNVIPMCEAGVEEAMAHINHINTLSNNFGISGWRPEAGVFRKELNLNGGQCRMEITPSVPPTITVRASLKEPIGNGDVTRAVRVKTKMNQRFPAAVLARGSVSLGGSGRVDSFNSTNLTDNTLGQYDPLKATDHALVGTTLRTVPAINVGTMTVYGYAATGPGGTVAVGGSGSVGSKPFVESAAGKGNVETGHHINDANYYIPPATLPTDFSPGNTVREPYLIGTTNYKYAIVEDGDYRYPGNILVGSGQTMLITAKARLHVVGNTTVSGSGPGGGKIILGPNASIEWYASGRTDIAGGGAINLGGYAINCSIICLNSFPVTYGGHAKLIGTIYAPLSPVTLSGTSDMIGAITCNSFSLSGGMGIHFDEALKGNPKIRFLAHSWSEIQP